ncbi:MAG: SDR family oxidoreductase [Actinomycetia bacterium]|nr:SDR family oxidoreductase [Actinomycetes bacterium]
MTGASRGIGLFVATHLASVGATVVGFARSSESLVDEWMTVEQADVSDPEQIASAFERATDRVGVPDLVVTFAGVAEALGPIQSVDVDDWWRAVEIDLRGTMLTVREALKTMLPVGAGRVVTVYGNLGDRQGENVSAFACAKAGIARLTEMAAAEVAATGVVVLGIHPGFVRTPMTESLAWGEEGTTWLPSFGVGAEDRWGGAEAAADLVLRVASGEADELSGRILRINDDIAALVHQSNENSDHRRLRLDLD